MQPHWKLSVEELGRIARAEVALRRLTLFVGPNNSGKSYLASLLWGLVALQHDLQIPDCPERAAVDAWITRSIPDEVIRGTASISVEDLVLFDRLFAATLTANRGLLAKRIFGDEQVVIGDISLHDAASPRPTTIEWAVAEGEDRTHIVIDDGLEPNKLKGDFRTSRRLEDMRMIILHRTMFRRLFRLFQPFNDSYATIDPVFLPASRTGYMQLYKTLARQSLRSVFQAERDQTLELTTPSYHFIDLIAFGIKSNRAGRFTEEADFLESSMDGRFELLHGAGVNEYRFRPAGRLSALPMKLSSALVTELGPLVLVLRHVRGMPLLVLEEPEAHLHPALQRRLAQVIVRLVRKGLFVWITTHSENFCQQLNNFIKLGSLTPERRAAAQERLGYGPQDYLDLADVAGNEFRMEADGRSTVVEMRRTERGLVMPTFNREIIDLSREVAYLDGLIGDDQ